MVVLAGIHAVQTAIKVHPQRINRIFMEQGATNPRVRKISELAREQGIAIQSVPGEQIESLASMERHQGVAAEVRARAELGEAALHELLDGLDAEPLLLVLDGVTDPHNLGACLRTAEAAGVHAVVVPKDRASGLTPVVRKTSAGAAELVPLIQVTNLARALSALKDRGIWLVATSDQATISVYQQDLTGPLALVMGSEGQGVRRLTAETCDFLVSIPMQGMIESLNVSVATGVCLYEAVRQRRA